jgi:1,2-diacylglycerol 3-beta-glucosyltransferase
MSVNSWPESDSYNTLSASPLTSDPALSDVIDAPTLNSISESSPLVGAFDGRRIKAAVVLALIWVTTIGLHLVAWGSWCIWLMVTVMGIHTLRLLSAKPRAVHGVLSQADRDAVDDHPFVSLLVAAKNEDVVITRLVETMCSLDYPPDRYELWVIDDVSSDRTPEILDRLALQYPQLQVLHRHAPATGGKSGALNEVLPLVRGEILGIFDADAQVAPDLLQAVAPLFIPPQIGSVQVRKAIANAEMNFWTRGQDAEMALDLCFQQQRIAVQGIGELRGNGQFVRKQAMLACGGWNEETITDDLDLTLRLQLLGWDIDCLIEPAVQEEGVTTWTSLWHQRNRWAEGGYQRYLDFWRPILSNRLGIRKTFDLVLFWIIQYWLPNAAIPDTLMAIARHRLPLYSPVTCLAVSLSFWGIFTGLQRIQTQSLWHRLQQTLLGTLYMLHWFVIVACVSVRMSVRPKTLKWVKTAHHGAIS